MTKSGDEKKDLKKNRKKNEMEKWDEWVIWEELKEKRWGERRKTCGYWKRNKTD